MTPFARIEAAYAARPREEPFVNYLLWYHRNGFVFSRPDFFAMGRPVVRAAGREAILDLSVHFPSDKCDCWSIHAAAGNTARMWQILPWPLGWVCWTRLHDPLSEIVFVETERLKRICPPELSAFQ